SRLLNRHCGVLIMPACHLALNTPAIGAFEREVSLHDGISCTPIDGAWIPDAGWRGDAREIFWTRQPDELIPMARHHGASQGLRPLYRNIFHSDWMRSPIPILTIGH